MEEDDLLVLREKTKDDLEREEEEYKAFLEREVGGDLAELITVEAEGVVAEVEVKEDEEGTAKGTEGRKKAKKEKKNASKQKCSKEEEDQQFLLEYVATSTPRRFTELRLS